jgi:hypothetical protein
MDTNSLTSWRKQKREEKRVRQLERRVDALSSGATTTSGRARSAAKTSSARKRASSAGSRTTPKKPS